MSARNICLNVLFWLWRGTGPLCLFFSFQAALIYKQADSAVHSFAAVAMVAFGVIGAVMTWVCLLQPSVEWLRSKKLS